MTEQKNIVIYTDGCCHGNPGPGGYAAILLSDGQRKEISGGFAHTTNNRMELLAAIKSLEALNPAGSGYRVTLYSDSQYLVQSMTQGWAVRWRSNNWKRNKKEMAKNIDLWKTLLDLCEKHEVTFKWTKGHAGDPENERCDQLANEAARGGNLPPDTAHAAQEPIDLFST